MRDKIIYSEIVQSPQFFLDSKQYYPEATSFFITGQHLKLLIGVFNSIAFTFFFKDYYSGGGLGQSGYRYKKLFLEKIPVPPITKKNHGLVQKIESLVEATLINRSQSKNTCTEEAKIDELVYRLYSLTDDEVALVEKPLN